MADNREIPADVREFLRENIASYEHLEILLLLRRRAGETLSSESVAMELRVPDSAAAEALDHLVALNLLEVRPGAASRCFRYAPGSPSRAATVDNLAYAYDVDRLGVMHQMNTNAIERVRNRALHIFADAFVVGQKKDKNG